MCANKQVITRRAPKNTLTNTDLRSSASSMATQSTPLIENAVIEMMDAVEYGKSRKYGAIGFGIFSLIGGAAWPVVGFG